MAKTKLKVTNKCTSDLGTVVTHTVELLDADGVMKEYGIKDYHDNGGIIDTEIEDISTGEDVYIGSTLGKRIIDVLSDGGMPFEAAHVNYDIPGFEGTLEALDDILPSSDIVVPCSANLDQSMQYESE